jgi:hypothetical protein
MLFSGRDWQPTLIKRVIETLPTSTCVAKVATDAGHGFIKGMGNPAGNHSLATELVAAELAAAIGLHVPPFALVELEGIEIPMLDAEAVQIGLMEPGPAFISREIEGAIGDGGDVMLKRISNPDDVTKLVVFDTWIRNADRCPPNPENTRFNRDNLFFAKQGSKFALTAIDHSHCFVEGILDDLLGEAQDLLNDEDVYGLFPEFKPYIHARAVALAVRPLRQIDVGLVQRIVASVPIQWDLTPLIRAAWVNFICERAQKVAKQIPALLVADPCLDL